MPNGAIKRALALLRTVEGGYVDDARDNGGATNHGVSLRAVRGLEAENRLSDSLFAALDSNGDGVIDEKDVRGWTWEIACAFYREHYWDKIRADEFPFPVAVVLFDSAVNEGPQTAIKHFQRAQSLVVDGIVGPKTLAAAELAAATEDSLKEFLVQFAGRRLDRYRNLDDAPAFFRGWANRTVLVTLDAFKEAA